MVNPTNSIQKLLSKQREKISKNDFDSWGNIVFQIKRAILKKKNHLTPVEWKKIRKQIHYHTQELNQKYCFFHRYNQLLFTSKFYKKN